MIILRFISVWRFVLPCPSLAYRLIQFFFFFISVMKMCYIVKMPITGAIILYCICITIQQKKNVYFYAYYILIAMHGRFLLESHLNKVFCRNRNQTFGCDLSFSRNRNFLNICMYSII